MPSFSGTLLIDVILAAWAVLLISCYLTRRFLSATERNGSGEPPASPAGQPNGSRLKFSIVALLMLTMIFALASNWFLLSRNHALARAQIAGQRTEGDLAVEQIQEIGLKLGLQGPGRWDRLRERPAGAAADLLSARLKRRVGLAETLQQTHNAMVDLLQRNRASQSEVMPRDDQVSLRRVLHLPVAGEIFYRELNIHVPAAWSARVELEIVGSEDAPPGDRRLTVTEGADGSLVNLPLRAGHNRLTLCLQAENETSGDPPMATYWVELNGERSELFQVTRPSGWSYSGMAATEQSDLPAMPPERRTTLVQLQGQEWGFQAEATLITNRNDDE